MKLHLYYVVPIVRDSLQVAVDPKCWYGLHFDRVISSKLTDYDKEKEYKAFLDNCKWQIEKYRYYSLDHFEKIPNSRELNGFKNAIKVRLQKTIDKSYVILRPVDEKYENRNGSILIWIFVSFGVGFSLLLIALIFPGYNRFYHEEIMSKKK